MDHIENSILIVIVQQYLDRYRGNSFTEQLPNDSPGVVGVFTGRHQAMNVPSRHRWIARAIRDKKYPNLI
jgi:hypothetical protein